LILLFRILFFIALIGIFTLAVLPDYNALPPIVSMSDKLNHASAFSLLSILYILSYSYYSLKKVVLTLLGYGILIEVTQAFLPTRSSSIEDIVADLVGILLGIFLLKIVHSINGAIKNKAHC
jgi:VanZ family protein